MYWSATELKICRNDALWTMPFSTLLLYMREARRERDKNCMTLQDKEMIDNMT